MLKLMLQYFGLLMPTGNWLEKSLMLGKIEGRRRGCQRMRWLDGIIDAMNTNLGKLWDMMRDREVWRTAVHGVAKSWTQLSDWATTYIYKYVWAYTSWYIHISFKGTGRQNISPKCQGISIKMHLKVEKVYHLIAPPLSTPAPSLV